MVTQATIGSLFTGYAGLDMATEHVFGARTVWHSENDPAASRLLAYRLPGVPNHGDIATIDWATVEPVDVITGGFPCQDVSNAGKRAGLRPGTRSGLWSNMAYAISQLRPAYVVAENVRGLLSAEAHSDVEPCAWCLGDAEREPAVRALGAVLADLADLGYDARWCGLRAADVGAPHARFRVFILAVDTDAASERRRPQGRHDGLRAAELVPDAAADARREAGRPEARLTLTNGGPGSDEQWPAKPRRRRRSPAPDASCDGPIEGDLPAGPAAEHGRPHDQGGTPTAANASGNGRHQGWPEPARQLRGSDAAECSTTPADTPGERWPGRVESWPDVEHDGSQSPYARPPRRVDWGAYGPAIERWEHVLGRVAPNPTEPTGRLSAVGDPIKRLSPRFVEFMMGLPEGWVTDVPAISRNDQLRMLGNGLVPQQAVVALHALLNAEAVAA